MAHRTVARGGRTTRRILFLLPLAAALAGVRSVSAQPVPGPSAAAFGAAQQAQQDFRIRELQQIELDTRLRANSAIPPGQRVLVDFGAYLQLNYLSLDDSAHDSHGLRQVDLLPYLRVNFDGAQELFLRGRIGYRDFNPGDSFTGRGDETNDGDLDRGYYRIDLARYNAAYGGNLLGAKSGESNLTIEAGRDLAYWANGLVLARTIDGVFIDVQMGALDAQFIAGVTPVRTVDFDSTRPAFDYNTRRGFYGSMVTLQAGDHRPYIYGLIQRDYNSHDEILLDSGISDTKFNYNSWYIGAGSSGALTDHLHYGIEFAYQGGWTLSNSFRVTQFGIIPDAQTRDQIGAAAVDGRLDYLLNDSHDTRLSFEVIAASGDDDRGLTNTTFNGNAIGTKDHAFNAFGILNTGLALAPEVSNIFVLRFGAATIPFPQYPVFRRMQIGTDLFILNKFRRDAAIDEPTSGGERFLGVEPDIYVNWELTSDLTLALRYGVFFPNESAFNGDDQIRQFLFAGLTFSF